MIPFILMFFQIAAVSGQSLVMEVVASSGDTHLSTPKASLEWTLGEIVASRLENNAVLTQGFQQSFDVVTHVFNDPDISVQTKIYPNPTTNNLTIESNRNTIRRVEIRDLFGRKIFVQKVLSQKEQLKLPDLPTGTYMLSVYQGSGLSHVYHVYKLVINNL